jgi:hypothetical protein
MLGLKSESQAVTEGDFRIALRIKGFHKTAAPDGLSGAAVEKLSSTIVINQQNKHRML